MNVPWSHLLLILLPWCAYARLDLDYTIGKRNTAEYLGKVAKHYKKYNNPQLATQYQTLAIEAQDYNTLYNQVCECVKQGKKKQARAYLRMIRHTKTNDTYFASSDRKAYHDFINTLVSLLIDNKVKKAINYASMQQLSTTQTNFCNENYLHTLAYLCISMNKYDAAEKCFIKALMLGNNQDINNHRQIGYFYQKQGHLDRAAFHFSHIPPTKRPLDDTYALAKIYYKQRNLHAAKALLLEIEDKYHPEAYLYLALIYHAQSDYDNYMKYVHKISSTLPATVQPAELQAYLKKKKQKEAETWLLAYLGQTYVQLDQFESALPHLEHALALDPHNTFVLIYLGKTYRKLGKFMKSEDTYQRLFTLDDHLDSELWYEMGKIAHHNKQYARAEFCYRTCMAQNPLYPDKVLCALMKANSAQHNYACIASVKACSKRWTHQPHLGYGIKV